MTPEEFFRSTPRIVSLAIEGHRRRRAWAAFHAGYGMHAKDAELGDLLGKPRPVEVEEMSDEQLVQNIRRWRIATTSGPVQ